MLWGFEIPLQILTAIAASTAEPSFNNTSLKYKNSKSIKKIKSYILSYTYFPILAQNGLSTAIAALLKTPNADL
jgi:hypothetical protein